MPKEQKIWNIRWLKNDTKECGAQAEVIARAKSDEIVIASFTQKNGRMWANTLPANLLNLTATNKGIYEIIQADKPRKVYFDVDGSPTLELKTVVDVIEKQFPGARFQISGYENETKHSYHITLSNYYFKDQAAQHSFVAWIHTLSDDLGIDTKVYSPNRLMKCALQSKNNLLIQEVIQGMVRSKHFILTDFDDDAMDAALIDWTNPLIQAELEKNKRTHYIDIMDMPEMLLKIPKTFNYASATIQEKLAIVPAQDCSHNINIFLMSYFKENSGSFIEFWNWKKQKDDTPEKYNYWSRAWEGTTYKYRDKTFETLLKRLYPKFKKYNWSSVFADDCVITSPVRIHDDKYLKSDDVCDGDVYLTDPMGRNKTGSVLDWIKEQPKDTTMLWISARIAYSKSLRQRMEDEDVGFSAYTDGEQSRVAKSINIPKYKRCVCSLESISYTYPNTYDVMIIDEVESLPQVWVGATTNKKRTGLWNRYLDIIRSAKKIVLMDAFPKQSTINWFEHITGRTITVVAGRHVPDTRPLTIIHDYMVWKKRLVDDIKAGQNIFIQFPYVNEFEGADDTQMRLSAFIQAACKIEESSIILHNGRMGDKEKNLILSDVNKNWSTARVVICNTSITVGINFDLKGHFHKVYSYYSTFTSPRNTIQTMGRIREVVPGVLFLDKARKNNRGFECDFDDPLFCKMKRAYLAEEHAKGREMMNYFCDTAGYTVIETVLDSKQLANEIHEEFAKLEIASESLFSWDKIPEVINIAELETKIFTQVATMTDKLAMEKYRFLTNLNQAHRRM